MSKKVTEQDGIVYERRVTAYHEAGHVLAFAVIGKKHGLPADAPRSYCCPLLPRGFRKSFVKNEKTGRGGGDRTTCGVEDAQVIDSTKRQRGEKPQRRLTEVHRRNRLFG